MGVDSVAIGLKLQSSSSTTSFSVYAFNWSSGEYSLIYSGSGSVETNISVGPEFINQVNGTVFLTLDAFDTVPFTIQIDNLNAFPEVSALSQVTALIVGVGGTNFIDAYTVSTAGSGGINLNYSVTLVTPGNVFDGSATLTYDNNGTLSLLLINVLGLHRLIVRYVSMGSPD